MYKPYSRGLRRVLRVAASEARRLGDSEVSDSHIFLSLLEADSGLVVPFLEGLGFNVENAVLQIENRLGDTTTRDNEGLNLSSQVKQSLAKAFQLSQESRQPSVCTEFLMLAFLRDPDSAPAKIIKEQGLELEAVYSALIPPQLYGRQREQDSEIGALAWDEDMRQAIGEIIEAWPSLADTTRKHMLEIVRKRANEH